MANAAPSSSFKSTLPTSTATPIAILVSTTNPRDESPSISPSISSSPLSDAAASTSTSKRPIAPTKPKRIEPKDVYIPHWERTTGKYVITPENLRRVLPYYFTYNTFAKGRWIGRTLGNIFTEEMRERPGEYYAAAIEAGLITVNNQQATVDTVIDSGDLISHKSHRHEPPVNATDVEILAETDELLIINKPPGVPVHPTGRYFYNSVSELIRVQRGADLIPRPANRLDRLTSGIMFFGKSKHGTETFTKQLRDRNIHKEYTARVIGQFPEGTIVCGGSITLVDGRIGLHRIRANGKHARTIFKRLAYYPPTASSSSSSSSSASATVLTIKHSLPWSTKPGHSIIRCYPITGRTHQLRVHLQALGHPIANDPIYANQDVFGPNLGAATDEDGNPLEQLPDETICERLERMGKDVVANAVDYRQSLAQEYEARRAERLNGEKCPDCGVGLYTDPGAHELGIYLHARRYACASKTCTEPNAAAGSGDAWAYETELPAWAMPPPQTQGPTKVTRETDLTEEEWQREIRNTAASALPNATKGSIAGFPSKPGKEKDMDKGKRPSKKERKKQRKLQKLESTQNAVQHRLESDYVEIDDDDLKI